MKSDPYLRFSLSFPYISLPPDIHKNKNHHHQTIWIQKPNQVLSYLYYNTLPSSTSIPSDFNKYRSLCISSLSSRISLALASSLTIALHTICFARSAYL